MALESGQVIDEKYRVVRLIGEGGMGAVYEGENVRIKRRVAIKTLHAHIAKNAQVVTRFEREAQAAGRIGSDHILEVLDLGSLPNGDRFIVMEFLDGEPLAHRIARQGRMTSAQIIPIMRQVLEGLDAAHAAGITHRDLKPDNIYILRQKAGIADFVKIIDFGISKFHSDQSGSVAMTQAGSLMGTPLYMSPEQANGSAEADACSDIYSLGMIMYEALSGSTPFTAQNLNELLFKIVLSEIPPLETVLPGIEPSVAAIVGKATAKKREDRYASAREMIGAVDAVRATLAPTTLIRSGSGASWRPGPGPMQTPAPVLTPQPMLSNTPQPITAFTPQAGYPNVPPTPHTQQVQNTPFPPQRQTPNPQMGQTPWPAAAPMGARVANGTDGAWGHQSQAPVITSAKSKAPLVVGLTIGGIAMLAIGGFAISRAVSHPTLAAAAAESSSATAAPPASTPEVSSAAAVPEAGAPATDVPTGDPAAASASATAAAAAPGKKGTATLRPIGAPTGTHVTKPAPTAAATGTKKPDWGY